MQSFSEHKSLRPTLSPYCVSGRMASSGHTNDFDNTQSRHNEKSQDRGHPQRAPHVVFTHTGGQRVGQGLVHVSDKYGPHEEPSWLSRCSG